MGGEWQAGTLEYLHPLWTRHTDGKLGAELRFERRHKRVTSGITNTK